MKRKLYLKKVKREESGLFEREINKKKRKKNTRKTRNFLTAKHGHTVPSTILLSLPHTLHPQKNSNDFIIASQPSGIILP